jgi:hypothetical protein
MDLVRWLLPWRAATTSPSGWTKRQGDQAEICRCLPTHHVVGRSPGLFAHEVVSHSDGAWLMDRKVLVWACMCLTWPTLSNAWIQRFCNSWIQLVHFCLQLRGGHRVSQVPRLCLYCPGGLWRHKVSQLILSKDRSSMRWSRSRRQAI